MGEAALPGDVRIVVADDHEAVRETLALVLDRCEGIRVVGASADARSLLELARAESPAVVLLDLRFGDRSGLDVALELGALAVPPKVVLLSAHVDDGARQAALRLGVKSVLAKGASLAEICAAIRDAAG